jgi:hypothetical protein
MQSGSFAGARRRGRMFRCLVMSISRVTIYYVHAQARYILLSQDSLTDHVEAYKTDKRVLGQEHPDTLTSMANLASTYRNQGRWKEAEDWEVLVMETRKRVLGQEHPDTLTCNSGSGNIYAGGAHHNQNTRDVNYGSKRRYFLALGYNRGLKPQSY